LAKHTLPSEEFETPMNMEITIVKTFCDLAITFSKNSHFGHFFQDFGHKLGKNLATLAVINRNSLLLRQQI